jgi:hypothetical protein
MEERARFLIGYAARHHPVTVRQLYYRAEVESLLGIDKTDASHDKIQRRVLQLRRERGRDAVGCDRRGIGRMCCMPAIF